MVNSQASFTCHLASRYGEGFSLPSELGALLWDAVPLGICLLSADQTLLFANRSAGRLLHRSSRDCVGKTLSELVGHRLDLTGRSKPQEFGNSRGGRQ